MAKKNKKFRFPWFALFMVLYAALFLVGARYGLEWFWGYIEAYELSQPEHAITHYMEQLSNDAFYEASAEAIAQLDSNLITEEACHAMIDNAVAGGVTYARNRKESTSEKNVYMLLSGERTIGKVVTEPGEPDEYGFRVWSATEDSFDFTFLMGTGKTVTVPHDFTVSINGIALDESYITQTGIQYATLKDYYKQFEGLPYMVTYETPGIWGSQALLVTDPAGNIVTIDETTDMEAFMRNCTQEEQDQIMLLTSDFLDQFMVFVSCPTESRRAEYKTLCQYIVDDSPLEKRMYESINGLSWVSQQEAELVEMKLNNCTNMGNGRYLCDVTYVSKTTRYTGSTTDTTNTKIIILAGESQMLIESMQNY